jgi:hypothetical protein
MHKNEVIYCYECGRELQEQDTVYYTRDGEHICEDCRDDYYTCCEDCDELVPTEDIIAVDNDSRYVCEDCASEYSTCDHCGGLFSVYGIAVSTDYITLCDSCYNNYYFTCAGCDEVFHIDNGECIGDYMYCESCAQDRRSSILPYSYKPYPIFFGEGADGYYGVELEIDGGEQREDAAQDIQAAGEDHIYIKEDGSLSSEGMEIVTHPATLDYHVNNFPWTEICDTAISYGYLSHDTDTCGLHIHASRSLFGDTEIEQDLTIAKIILLIDRWYDTHILRFARRDYNKMRQWADKPNAGIRPEDCESDAVQKSKKTATDRYKAVNLCNYKTIEFRFFRGTLKRDTIIASIQWVDTIIQYCRETPLQDLFNATWDEIFGNTEHVELTNYLKQRNLYNVKEGK